MTAAWAGLRARRLPVDTVMAVLELFDTRYWDFTARHFWEKLSSEHGFSSYNWVRLTLQAHGRIRHGRHAEWGASAQAGTAGPLAA